jgi:hypothetical protein
MQHSRARLTIHPVIVEAFPGLERSRRRLLRLHRAAPVADEPLASVLSLRAVELLRAVETGTIPPHWRVPDFGREVDEIRAQLGPIELRGTLAASFGREAGLRMARHGAAAAPLDLAYAVRWLELDPGRPRPIPAWTSWLPAEPG